MVVDYLEGVYEVRSEVQVEDIRLTPWCVESMLVFFNLLQVKCFQSHWFQIDFNLDSFWNLLGGHTGQRLGVDGQNRQ